MTTPLADTALAHCFDLLVFDLDGTLADTAGDLADSVNHVLGLEGRPPLSVEAVRRQVGGGARRLLEHCLGAGAGAEDVERAVARFLEHYRAHCVVRTRLYPGVREALDRLGSRHLCVLTNKPLDLACKVLSVLGVADRFARVEGGDSAPRKKPDPAGLRDLLRTFDCPPGRALLVGDTAVDAETARLASVHFAGVTYGYRPEELRALDGVLLLESLLDLCRPAPPP